MREDPECRLRGVTGRMNIRAPQPQLVPQPPPTAVGGDAAATPPPPSAPTAAGRSAEASLDRKIHFLTKGGLHLLYEPTAEDIDNQTGEVLSREDAASYESYQQRLCERHRVGEKADRLVRIVDRFMPRVADENRAYVIHYRAKWGRCFRRKIRRRQKAEEGKAKRKRTSTSGTPERGEVQEGARRRTDKPAAKNRRDLAAECEKRSQLSGSDTTGLGGRRR